MIVELSEGLVTLENHAFHEYESLARIKIPATVKHIHTGAFRWCSSLMNVEIGEGLLEVNPFLFARCTSLENIRIPSSVMKLHNNAFRDCTSSREVELCEGLLSISWRTFSSCSPLEQIKIPSTVNEIGFGAFLGCTQLKRVDLCEGLVNIGFSAFEDCLLLEHIIIPSTVKRIGSEAFKDCQKLSALLFCEEMEEFVTGQGVKDWWNGSSQSRTLRMYSFLAQHSIPSRLSKLKARKWLCEIYGMLKHAHSMEVVHSYDCHFDIQCDAITEKLGVYEKLSDVASLLELALWKSIFLEQHVGCILNADNLIESVKTEQHRMDCGATVIIPNVLSFLLTIGDK